MTDLHTAAKLALEALEYVYEGANNQGPHTGISWRCASNKVEPAITALRRALEQPAQQEPLTDEQIEDAVREADLDWHQGWTLDDDAPNRFTTLARAIEAKLREKNA